jgi:hypothetical protein
MRHSDEEKENPLDLLYLLISWRAICMVYAFEGMIGFD